MIWIFLIALWVIVVAGFVWTLCKTASDADDYLEEHKEPANREADGL